MNGTEKYFVKTQHETYHVTGIPEVVVQMIKSFYAWAFGKTASFEIKVDRELPWKKGGKNELFEKET